MKLDVLGNGYVRMVETNLHQPIHGNDLSVVNAARASFLKESEELSPADVKLLNFLAREGHMSPFRHCTITYEIKAPMMVARQW